MNPDVQPIAAKSIGPPKMGKSINALEKKIKVLWYSDFLRPTGFGNVAEAIMKRLLATGRYEFEVVAINHYGAPYNIPGSRYYQFKDVPVWPAYSLGDDDMFGRARLSHLIESREFDILFVLQDTFNMTTMKNVIEENRKKKKFSYVFYFPIDGDVKEDWVIDGINVADFPVVYTEYGKEQINKVDPRVAERLDIIYHGANMETFHPFKSEQERQEFRRTMLGLPEDAFLIGTVNRNQPRKDLPRLVLAFNEFCMKNPTIPAYLYMHCHIGDMAGFDIKAVAQTYLDDSLQDRLIMPNPEAFKTFGYPIELVNKFYGAFDVATSATLGEGWGLMTTEAMATKTPVAIPNNTTAPELLGEDQERGYLVKCGERLSDRFMFKNDNEQFRPLTDVEDMVRVWKHIYDNPEEAKEKAEVAYNWLKEITWGNIAKQWDKLFQEAYNASQRRKSR